MCGNKNTTTGTTAPTPQAMGAYSNLITNAQSLAQQPYVAPNAATSGVAGLNALQTAGLGNASTYGEEAQPYYGLAGGYLAGAAQPITTSDINQYYSPFQQDVVNATEAQFTNQNAQQQQQLTGNEIAQGALGGNRSGVAGAILAGQQNLTEAPTIAGLENTGYNQAVQYAMNQFQQNPEAVAAGEANVGTGAQTAGLTGANAQFGLGTGAQQFASTTSAPSAAQTAWNYQQYLNQLAFPYQQEGFATGVVGSLGPAEGGTATTTTPAPSIASQIAGLGMGAYGLGALISDRRAKENLKRIGKLFDGQTIYRFNYKGDHKTRIGLVAQDVEKVHPDAVHDIEGVKHVDYDEATKDSIRRARGGVAGPLYYRDRGGVVRGYDLGGTPYSGGVGYIPQSFNFPHPNIMPQPPKPPQDQTQSTANQFAQLGKMGSSSNGGLFTNTSMGDSVNDYVQDLGDNFDFEARHGGAIHRDVGGDTPYTPDFDQEFSDASPAPVPDFNQEFGAVSPNTVAPGGVASPPIAPDQVPLPRPRPTTPGLLGPTMDAEAAPAGGVATPVAYTPEPIQSSAPLSRRERDNVIKTVYGEAGNQPAVGQAAVASVILNRQNSGKWGNSASSVVTAPYQFEPWNTQEGRSRMNTMSPQEYARIGKIVDGVYAGDIEDPTGGATHFFSPGSQAALGRPVPDWGKSGGLKIGDHLFFKPGDQDYAPEGGTRLAFNGEPSEGGGLKAPSDNVSSYDDEHPAPDVKVKTSGVAAEPGFFEKLGHNLTHLSPEAATAIASAGFRMAASRSPYFGIAAGEGGESGLSTYSALEHQKQAQEFSKAKIKMEADKLHQQSEHMRKMEGLAQDKNDIEREKANQGKRQVLTDMSGNQFMMIPDKSQPDGYRRVGINPPETGEGDGPLPVPVHPGSAAPIPNAAQPQPQGGAQPPLHSGTGFIRVSDNLPEDLKPAEGDDPRNEEYMAGIEKQNPQFAELVKGVAEYKIDPSKISGRSPQGGGMSLRDRVLAGAATYTRRTYDQTSYPAKQKAVNDFLAGTSPQSSATVMTAGSTAILHASELYNLVDQIKALPKDQQTWFSQSMDAVSKQANDAGVPFASMWAQWMKQKGLEGMPQGEVLNKWATMKQRYSEELSRFYSGGVGSEAERQRSIDLLDPAKSAEELKGGLSMDIKALNDKVHSYNSRLIAGLHPAAWKQAVDRDPGLVTVFKESREARDDILRKEAERKGSTFVPVPSGTISPPGGASAAPSRPVPDGKDRAYVAAHPEKRDFFIKRFGVEP